MMVGNATGRARLMVWMGQFRLGTRSSVGGWVGVR